MDRCKIFIIFLMLVLCTPAIFADANQTPQKEEAKPASNTAESYKFAEELIEIPVKPFVVGKLTDSELMNMNPQLLKLYEAAVNTENQKNILENPDTAIKAWTEVTKINQQNPFLQAASARIEEWKKVKELFARHQASLDKVKMLLSSTLFSAEQKSNIVLIHITEFGLSFGTSEAVNAIGGNSGIANNESLAAKIKEIRNKRCELKSATDCHNYAMKHAANEEEKAAYLKKACDLGSQAACSGNPPDETFVAAAVENVIEQPKEAKETATQSEDDKFKEELNQAGRKKRLIAATSTLVPGIVIGALGGLSFYGMSEAKKDRDKYVKRYNSLGEEASVWEFNKWKKKAKDADSRRKTYMILGGVGVGVGAALIATGITLYSIEFEGEKEVKKKYNISFGAKPMDGTIQFALNW